MVAWDPEIDGKYEVKESDLLERREAERKTAEKARVEAETAAARTNKELAGKTERMKSIEKQVAVAGRKLLRLSASLETLRKSASENLARAEYPKEVWEIEDGVSVSTRRMEKSEKSKNERVKYEKEKNMATILARAGHSVWLLPEENAGKKNPDAIVDGLIYDFKKIKFKQIERRFSEGLEQAGNVVLKIDDESNESRILGKIRKHIKGKSGKLFLLFGDDVKFYDFSEI